MILKSFKGRRSGFTLIELLVVIAIIGVLSSVVIQSLNSARAKSRNTTRTTQIDQIHKAMEISATTSGRNKLPYSAASWRCLGLTSGTCWGGSGYGFNTTVNTAVESGIAGGSIPRDPIFSMQAGDYYIYHSDLPDITTSSCTAVKCPAGAYLSWAIENSTNCGRGVFWGNISPGKQRCLLRVGDTVTN